MINGAAYDAHTGMRLSEESVQDQARTSVQAHVSHKKQARSQTLTRSHVTSPHKKAKSSLQSTAQVKRSPMISRFSTSDIKPRSATKKAPTINDVAPTRHPIQTKAEERKTGKQITATQVTTDSLQSRPAQEIKQRSIEKALQNAKPAKKEKKTFAKRYPRLTSISSAVLAVALLGGYLTYLNLPSISVRVAAAQAGIAATYPSYQPSGYSLNGPVAYSNGQVTMKFAANVGPQKFTVNQTKSSWDSSALLENYIEGQSEGDYQTLSDSGLTIYAYDNNAAWVNGGILHTIEGDAPLSPDQIRRIATSM